MKTYKVIQDCHGFQFRYWTAGMVVELEDSETPPSEHFELLSGVPAAESKAPETFAMSDVNKERAKNAPKTGMAYTPPADESSTLAKPKAGSPSKKK